MEKIIKKKKLKIKKKKKKKIEVLKEMKNIKKTLNHIFRLKNRII